MSLLLASNDNNNGSSYVVLEGGQWSIKRDSLLAWSHGVQLDPITQNDLLQVNASSSTDRFVISSPGQVTQIGLIEGETISVNSKSLVAISGINNEFKIVHDENLAIGIIPSSLKINQWFKGIGRYVPSSVTDFLNQDSLNWVHAIRNYLSKVSHGASQMFKLIRKPRDQFISIQGPQTLFVTNSFNVKPPIFTKEEINSLIK